MTRSITVVDYGSGNLLSVVRALERCDAKPTVTDSAACILSADRLLLPGVGAFGDGMEGLRARGLIEPILRFAAFGRPLLGICLGMQMLADLSEEFGDHEGLGLIPGKVVPIPPADVQGAMQKIPHIGWAELKAPYPRRWAGTLLEAIREEMSFYLVHSFQFLPLNNAHRLADCLYGGHRITAAVQSGGTVGLQFHPEKSGEAGLAVLRAFMQT